MKAMNQVIFKLRLHYLCFLHLLCIFWTNAEPLVEISQGILNGTIEESRNGRKYAAFLGIPYAKPPIGNLRFRNPEPAGKWNGIRQAHSFGSMCPQPTNDDKIIGNEDCLFLNIYTPRLFNSSFTEKEAEKILLPVMVYIHGGGFAYNSSDDHRANYLLNKDVILVVMNYRLGIFGFLSLGNSVAPGNFGLKDQVLSLKWVQENIEAFGGDPKKVTLFGESAGGMSIGLHALSKASEGVFHQYVMQSGSPLSKWSYRERSNAIEYAKKLAVHVSCPYNPSESFIACLKTKSVDTLINSKSIFDEFEYYSYINWIPTDEPEDDGAFLTDSPNNLIEQNQMKDLPFMTGCVTDEGLKITSRFSDNSSIYSYTLSKLDQLIPFIAGRALLDSTNEEEFTKAAKKFYFDDDFSDKEKFFGNFTNYVGDAQFVYPEIKMLEIVGQKMKSPIYWYSFGYPDSLEYQQSRIEKNKKLGVAHGDDVKYIFPDPSSNLTATDELISNLLVDLLTSFATNGKPKSDQFKSDDFWVPYNPTNNFHLQIGSEYNNKDPAAVTIPNIFFPERMDFWRKYTQRKIYGANHSNRCCSQTLVGSTIAFFFVLIEICCLKRGIKLCPYNMIAVYSETIKLHIF